MSQSGNQVGAPSASEVRSQLERILESPDFATRERLRGFLAFVVESTLEGRTERIKGYTIATEVFGRAGDFDPQIDPIVRIEAGKLRRRLEHFYLTTGATDPVLVEIPKGSYVPQFSYRPAEGEAASGISAAIRADAATPSPGRRAVIAALSLVLLIVLGLALWWSVGRPRREVESEQGQAAARQGPTRVMVMPFDYVTDTSPHPLLNEGLVNELIITLAAIPELEVLALRTAEEALDQGLTPKEIADSLQVDYLIEGDVRQQQSDVRVTVNVIDAAAAVVRESRHFEGSFDRVFDLEEDIARGIADSVAATATPGFERRLEATKERDPEVMALYYEATTLRDPPSDPVRSKLAEEAYQRVIELDPDFAGGHAGLAYVLAFRSWWRVSEQPEIDAQRALAAARMAVEKNPELGWAQMSLGIVLNISGDHEGALAAARRAAELSGHDPYVLTFSALVQTFEGDVEAAIPLAKRAIRLDPLSVRTPFRNILGAILFQAGRYQESIDILEENLELGGPDGPHVAYWRAGSLAALGRIEEARRELERASAFPYGFDMKDFLSVFRDPAEGGKLLETLRASGLG